MDSANSVKAFTLLGFPVRIHISWLVIAFLLTWTLAIGYFPAMLPGQAATTYWLMGLAGALGLFLSIILHELGHAVIARWNSIQMRGITLFIFGGVAEMEDEPPTARAEFVVAVAGPFVSFGIAALCFLVWQGGTIGGWAPPLTGVIAYLAVINAVVALFNLLPAFPLDGGRILRAFLWERRGNLRTATRTAAAVGSGFGIFLIVLGFFSLLAGNLIGGIWWAVLGLFLRGAAQASLHQVEVRSALRGEQTRRFMDTSPVTVAPSMQVDRFVEDCIYKHHNVLFPVVESGQLLGQVGLEAVKRIPREEWSHHQVGEVMTQFTSAPTVTPETDALETLSLMARQGKNGIVVSENGHLAGVVSMRNMLDFLSVKLELDESTLRAARTAAT